MPKVIGGRYGLSSKEFTPAMVKGVFDELAKAQEQEPLHRGHRRRRYPHQHRLRSAVLDRRPEDGARAVLRPGRRWHGGREQELDQDHRRRHRHLCAGLFRVRLEEVGLDYDLALAFRSQAAPVELPDLPRELRGVPPVLLPGAHRHVALCRPGRGVPAQQPLPRRRGLG